MYHAIRRVLVRYLELDGFRVVHISIQRRHLHLIVEAADEQMLSRSMQSFAINAARSINRAARRTGKVFAFRYKAIQIKTRRYARNAIAYVVNNWRRHGEDRGTRAAIDLYSSGTSFDGWSKKRRWRVPDTPLPVSRPRTALLAADWQWFGLVDPFERPGPDPGVSHATKAPQPR